MKRERKPRREVAHGMPRVLYTGGERTVLDWKKWLWVEGEDVL